MDEFSYLGNSVSFTENDINMKTIAIMQLSQYATIDPMEVRFIR